MTELQRLVSLLKKQLDSASANASEGGVIGCFDGLRRTVAEIEHWAVQVDAAASQGAVAEVNEKGNTVYRRLW